MNVSWRIDTPTGTTGALAIFSIIGDVEAISKALSMRPVPSGDMRLRSIAGIDDGVVARWSDTSMSIMPHGGAAVTRAIAERLGSLAPRADAPPLAAFPEASSTVEARALGALSRAASPRAIDLLLAQARLWAEQGETAHDPQRDRILDRLIDPPLVVAVGPPNVGKSSLLNALARRTVAIVADQPGTTRDHVGVSLDLDGLVVRYIDTPGRRDAAGPEKAALRISEAALARADLVLNCADHASEPVPLTPARELQIVLPIALRSDLGTPRWPHDRAVSALTGEGLPELARAIRTALVPDDALEAGIPWRFWS